MTNNNCCYPRNVSVLSHSCSTNLEHLVILCQLFFYLPWEFSMIVSIAISTTGENGLCSDHVTWSHQQTLYQSPGSSPYHDFDKANLTEVMENYFQNVTFSHTFDHCYTPFKNKYKATSLQAFGKGDQAAIFPFPNITHILHLFNTHPVPVFAHCILL